MDSYKTHHLKTVQPYFDDVCNLKKRFELRKNDRDFKLYDVLVLHEFIPETKAYTGRKIAFRVIHILSDFEGLKDGWVAMSLDYGAAPIDQHECNSNSMESYSFSDCFGWEKVKCNVCGKVDGKPIGEMYRKDGNYR